MIMNIWGFEWVGRNGRREWGDDCRGGVNEGEGEKIGKRGGGKNKCREGGIVRKGRVGREIGIE
jgi:hypothetical protein